MDNLVQRSDSTFRELHQAAGYRTAIALTRQLRHVSSRRPISTLARKVNHWENGGVPTYRYIPKLARAFHIEELECIRLLWNETLGDPCECGCGGEKVRPTNPAARRLYIKSSCERCGKERTDRTGHYHRKLSLCKLCCDATRTVERINLRCVGYRFDKSQLWAKRCPRVKGFRPNDLARFFRRKNDDKNDQHIFADVTRGEYRCRWCAGAFRMLSWSERNLKDSAEKKNQNPPRIRNIGDLQRERSNFVPTEFKEDGRAGKGPPPGYRVPFHRALRRWWRKKDRRKFPGIVQGLCIICDGLLLNYNPISHGTGRPVRFHQKCFLKYQSAHNGMMPPEVPRRGAPVRIENLRKHFAWAIRHKVFKDSLGEIAEDFGVNKNAIVKGVAFIDTHLKEPELVPASLRPIVALLRSI